MSSKKKAGGRGRRVYDTNDAEVEDLDATELAVGSADGSVKPPRKPARSNNNAEDDDVRAAESKQSGKSSRKKKSSQSSVKTLTRVGSEEEGAALPLDQQLAGDDEPPKRGHAVDGKIVIDRNKTMEDEYTLGHSACPPPLDTCTSS